MTNDDQLLARAKNLDPAALQTLHEQFYEPVARYIRFKVGNPRVVEDLSGEVFVRVLESLRRGNSWRDSAKGWIMGIAHHVIVDYYRKRERMTEVKLSDQLKSSDNRVDPSYQMILSERKEQLMEAIEQLTEDQRDVILMRFIEGIPIKGVAEALDKTPNAVKALQYRAMRALAEKLQNLSSVPRQG